MLQIATNSSTNCCWAGNEDHCIAATPGQYFRWLIGKRLDINLKGMLVRLCCTTLRLDVQKWYVGVVSKNLQCHKLQL